MMRILLVDDHPIVRQGIRHILTDRMAAVTIGEAADAPGGLQHIRTAEWDVVVLDITMPGQSGLDLLKQVRQERPTLPVLVLSMHPATQFAARVLRAGAQAYVVKDTAPRDLVDAIERVMHGQRFVSREAIDGLGKAGGQTAHDALSDREYQVLRMLGSGRRVSEIGNVLGLSVKTISTYRARVLRKLEMTTNAELMRYAIENGLLDS